MQEGGGEAGYRSRGATSIPTKWEPNWLTWHKMTTQCIQWIEKGIRIGSNCT
jgi:hypothetical protein